MQVKLILILVAAVAASSCSKKSSSGFRNSSQSAITKETNAPAIDWEKKFKFKVVTPTSITAGEPFKVKISIIDIDSSIVAPYVGEIRIATTEKAQLPAARKIKVENASLNIWSSEKTISTFEETITLLTSGKNIITISDSILRLSLSLELTVLGKGDGSDSAGGGVLKSQVISFASPGPFNYKTTDSPSANVASGGAGSGAITYSSTNTSVATVDANTGVLSFHSAGFAIIVATKAADTTYDLATAAYAVNVDLTSQMINFASSGPFNFLITDTPTANVASGGEGSGAVTYSSSDTSVATVDLNTGNLSLHAIGSTIITATKAADDTYSSVTASYTVNVSITNLVNQTISFASGGPLNLLITDTPPANVASGGAGSGAITYSSSNTSVATVDANTGALSLHSAGYTIITATKAADAVYGLATATYIVNVSLTNLTSQTISFANGGPLNFVITDTPPANVASGGSGSGAITYSSSNTSVATVDANTGSLNLHDTGFTIIIATKAADTTYDAATAAYAVNVSLASQTISFASSGPFSFITTDTPLTNIASGGAGSGAITYSSSNTSVATVDANTGDLTLHAAGSTVITATKAADTVYGLATATYTVNVSPASLISQTISFASGGPLNLLITDTPPANVASGGAGSGDITYSSTNTSVATVDTETGVLTLHTTGFTIIIATKAADTTYDLATAAYAVNVDLVSQAISFASGGPLNLVITDTPSANLASGGAGSGAITYSSSNTSVATVDANTGTLSLHAVGSTVITATKAQDAVYGSATATYTVNVSLDDLEEQTISFASPGPFNFITTDTPLTNIASGGAGSGTITYSSSNTSVATVDANTGDLTLHAAGSTVITATKAADTVYGLATATYTVNVSSASLINQTISFASSGPLNLLITDTPPANVASGGAGSGDITYSSTNTSVATVDTETGALTLHTTGFTIIIATKAADTTYDLATAAYAVNVDLVSQAISFASGGPLNLVITDPPTANVASGGAGSGAITYSSSNTSVATVDANTGTLSLHAAGSTIITATKAADDTYSSATATYTVNISLASQTISFASPGPFSFITTDPPTANVASGGAGSGAITYSSSNTSVATVDANTGALSLHTAGSSIVTATKAADGSYSSATATYTVNVSLASQTISFASNGPLNLIITDIPSINVASGGAGSGSITYTSSNPAVATVDTNTGSLSLHATGSTIIVATKAADAIYSAATAFYAVNVYRSSYLKAWVGKDDTEIIVPDGTSDVALYRYRNSGCNIASYASCVEGQMDFLDSAEHGKIIDTALTLTEPAFYHTKIGSREIKAAVSTAIFAAREKHTGLVFNNKIWIIGGDDDEDLRNDVWSSQDGIIWNEETASAGFSARESHTSLAFNNKMWVIGGYDGNYKNDVWSSEDGINWTEVTDSAGFMPRESHTSLVFNDKMWVIGGYGDGWSYLGDVWSSEDGVNWNEETGWEVFSARKAHTSLVFNNKMWVIGGNDGSYKNDVWSSEDGVNWTEEPSLEGFSAREGHVSLVFDNKMWVIGGYDDVQGDSNDVWSSTDGINWTEETAAAEFVTREEHISLVFNSKMWIIGGEDGGNDVWSSADGITWVYETTGTGFSAHESHTSIVFNSKMWIIGGYKGSDSNEVWSSSDGINWTEETASAAFSAREDHTSLVFNNKMWVIGGWDGNYKNDVWSSSDGINWAEETASAAFPARYSHTSLVFDNKMWVIGGYDDWDSRNDVWSSSDGINWTEETGSAAFAARASHTSLVFDNKMWVIGGFAMGYKNDVWSSEDGVNWTEETDSAAFAARASHTSLVFDNKMWVIGGDDDDPRNDVWSSEDGVNWTEETVAADFAARYEHTSLVFDNKMWVIGGDDGDWERNDVWQSENGADWRLGQKYQVIFQ